jgi:hypothetical protein
VLKFLTLYQSIHQQGLSFSTLHDSDNYYNDRQKGQFDPVTHRGCNRFQAIGCFSSSDDTVLFCPVSSGDTACRECGQSLHGPDILLTPYITWGELVYGAEKSNQRKKALQLLAEFKSFVPVLPIPESSGNTYGPSAHYWNPKERLLVTTICGSQHTQKRQLLRLLPTMKESFNACLV